MKNKCFEKRKCFEWFRSISLKWGKIWIKRAYVTWLICCLFASVWIFWYMNSLAIEKRKETLLSMCDKGAKMLQDQFNLDMNHVKALSIMISTFHHVKKPSAIDQATFARYAERTAFERPLTSGVAYAVRVLHSEREQFQKQQGWTIKKMDTLPSPVQEEYAPVIFAQDTVSHVISFDMLSGKEERENVLRARASGKGVLTAPFKLLKTKRLGIILTFAVYKMGLPSDATPNERILATDGYLVGVFDIESLVNNLLHQLASKQAILVNVYDTTNFSDPISMYGSNVTDDRMFHVSSLSFGDSFRKHEMHCRFKQTPPWPTLALSTAIVVLIIGYLIGHILNALANRITRVEDECRLMMESKKQAVAADTAKSQFFATVSHELRTPMNDILGMLQMLMDTELDIIQQDYVRTAQVSVKALVSLINEEVPDQAKIESGKLELEAVQFDIRAIMDDLLSLFSGNSQDKGLELAVYISDRVPEVLIGDPGRFRQIITNLMGNSIKFTDKGHIFLSIQVLEEVDVEIEPSKNTLSGFPVADRRRSWGRFKTLSPESLSTSSDLITLIVSVEDTGAGIPLDAHPKVFTPFMQVESISRTHGGTGIGLSISKCLVGLMSGEIGFASEPRVGSTFTFTAVFSSGRSNSDDFTNQRIIKQASSPISSELQGMTALVVDSRLVRAKVTRYHLQRVGVRVEIAPDLNQGLSQISSGGFNIVLVEKEFWDEDADLATQFANKLKEDGLKLFLLANSVVSPRSYHPTIIMKPLRASMLAACLQQAMSVGKGNPRGAVKPLPPLQNPRVPSS